MVTITKPSQPETIKAPVEPEVAVVPAISAEELEKLMADPVSTENGSLVNKILHGLEAVSDWISGPPMTQRDKLRRDIAEVCPSLRFPY